MNIVDLHEEFLTILQKRFRKKDISSNLAEILHIEKDAVYRRLSGKVNFSVREIGIIADRLKISLDQLIRGNDVEQMWIPFILKQPLKVESIDAVFDITDLAVERIEKLRGEPREAGNVYNGLPLEFYIYSPVLTKFMFFKWGYNFVGTEEFNNYATWKLPQRADGLKERMQAVYNFEKTYYIWDESLIANLCKEVSYFHRLHVMTEQEKNEVKDALKDMLNKLELTMQGKHTPSIVSSAEADFYLSSVNLGFIGNYFMAGESHVMEIVTGFSFAILDENIENFRKLKQWLDSFKNISTLFTHSGRIERRIYFEEQRKIIDEILK